MSLFCFSSVIFSPTPARGEGRSCLLTVQMSAHSSVPASGPAERKDAAEEGCDEGALIDKLNYQQSQNPWAFFFYLAWREIFSAIIPAVMKFLLEMSRETRRTPRGQRKSQFCVALNWVCAAEFVVEGGWMWSHWRLFVAHPKCWWDQIFRG